MVPGGDKTCRGHDEATFFGYPSLSLNGLTKLFPFSKGIIHA